MIPQFTMSQYATKEALLEAKCAWLEEQIDWLQQNEAEVEVSAGNVHLRIYDYLASKVLTFTGESLLDCIDQARENEEKQA